MIDKIIYKYEREPNKFTVSTEKPNAPYITLHRLIADSNKILYKGDMETPCVDTYDITEWQEKEFLSLEDLEDINDSIPMNESIHIDESISVDEAIPLENSTTPEETPINE